MPQRPLAAARVLKADIAKFNFILIVALLAECPFFHWKRSAVHLVGNIEKFKRSAQKSRVIAHGAEGGNQVGKAAGQGGNGPYILRYGPNAEGARPSLEADKHIDKPGKKHGNSGPQRPVRAHGPFGDAGNRRPWAKDAFRHQLFYAEALLPVDAQIQRPLAVKGKHPEKIKAAVAKLGLAGGLDPIALRLIGKQWRQKGHCQ